MANNILKIESVRKWVRNTLGEPVVCVELEDIQIEQALENAFLWWSTYRGWYLEQSIAVTASNPEYNLDTLITTPTGNEVVDVVKVYFDLNPNFDLSGAWPGFLDVDGFPYGDEEFNNNSGGYYSGLVQWMQQRKIASHVLSADRDWMFNAKTKLLILTPGEPLPSYSGTAVVRYETTFKKEHLTMVNPSDAYLIRERALAEAKRTLGMIRGKYTGGLPAAQGQVQLDGSELRSEAVQEMERLDQKIMELMPPPQMIIG
jgi:hypothetical protein